MPSYKPLQPIELQPSLLSDLGVVQLPEARALLQEEQINSGTPFVLLFVFEN